MVLPFLTPDVFDALIRFVIFTGLIAAGFVLWEDIKFGAGRHD